MSALLNVGWTIWLAVSLMIVFEVVGWSGLSRMFPEGRRRWHLPVQLAALAFFAAAVLMNPWGRP